MPVLEKIIEKVEEEIGEKEGKKLHFAYTEVVRLMKQNLKPNTIIREPVKVAMNELIYSILVDVCKEIDKFEYATVDIGMFNEATFGYRNIKRIACEREALLSRLEAMKKDIELMEIDIQDKMKLTEGEDLDVSRSP